MVKMLDADEATVKKVLDKLGTRQIRCPAQPGWQSVPAGWQTGSDAQSTAFGLAGVNNHTWTGGWGTVSYWNAGVANLEMHGKGKFLRSPPGE